MIIDAQGIPLNWLFSFVRCQFITFVWSSKSPFNLNVQTVGK